MSGLQAAARALGGEVVGRSIAAPGPGHSAADRSLSVWFDANGSLAVNTFSARDSWSDCMDYVRAKLGLPEFRPGGRDRIETMVRDRFDDPASPRIDLIAERQREQAKIARLWASSVDPAGTKLQMYLTLRDLWPLPEGVAGRVIRYCPSCPWRDETMKKVIRVPAMLARYSPIDGDIDPDGPPPAVHRTRLDRFRGRDRKKAYGKTAGLIIKLTPDAEVEGSWHHRGHRGRARGDAVRLGPGVGGDRQRPRRLPCAARHRPDDLRRPRRGRPYYRAEVRCPLGRPGAHPAAACGSQGLERGLGGTALIAWSPGSTVSPGSRRLASPWRCRYRTILRPSRPSCPTVERPAETLRHATLDAAEAALAAPLAVFFKLAEAEAVAVQKAQKPPEASKLQQLALSDFGVGKSRAARMAAIGFLRQAGWP